MIKTVKVGGRDLELAANAATPFRFRQVFKKDLLSVLADEKKAQDQGLETIMQLAFIMAKQAEKADMAALDDDAFIGWLEGFGSMAFVETAEDILNVYMDSTVSTAEP